MGLLRIAVIIAAGVAVLPSDRAQQERLVQRATSATTWVVTFCDRNGPTCQQANGLWKQFAEKAEFGAKLAYDLMQGSKSQDRVAMRRDGGDEHAAPVRLDARAGTLRPDDLQPVWRAAAKQRGGI